MKAKVALYDANYGNFAAQAYAEVRREAFGHDLGQNSWLTLEEIERFIAWLELGPSSSVLDVACGSGGPALHIAQATGCRMTGVDIHQDGIAAASRMAGERGLAERAGFRQADGAGRLPFDDGTFDALLCVDAINHLRNRAAVLAEWGRVLRPGGRLLFTDPIMITGIVDSEEIAIRASVGYFLFTPAGVNERLLTEAGLRVVAVDDATDKVATVARRWREARACHADALRKAEGEETFEGQQRFLAVSSALAAEGRLSRMIFRAERPAR
jgi:SAM-dependent methyltransferase